MIKQCQTCVLDTNDDPLITFDQNGQCNYCQEHIIHTKLGDASREKDNFFKLLIEDIKSTKTKSGYHCIFGLSGGLDSSYALYVLKQNGLNPLVVHLDNGWNSELAVQNIHCLVSKLGFDLYTHVIDWEEMRDIHLSLLHASVVDVELPTDHAIMAILFQKASQIGTRYIFTGENNATESRLPKHWVWNKAD